MKCDVAIVGAGPAGAWAARELARRGVSAAIFDPSHPREKPCGGGVTGRALELVSGAIAPLAVTTIRTARFTQPRTNHHVVVPLDSGALAVASRQAFDRSLLEAATCAGARHHRARVVRVEIDRFGVRLQTSLGEHRADFVIGADGTASLVRRLGAAAFRRDQLSIATGFFAHGVTSSEIVIELVSDPPGYIWSFPRPDHLAVGICAQADARVGTDALRARVAQWIRTNGIAEHARLQPYSWPIPSLGAHDLLGLEVAGPRWCLVGDAAGLVDPITREGIYFAVRSAAWAADAIVAGDLPHGYAARVQGDAIPELARAAQFKAGFFCPLFIELMLRAVQHSPAMRAVMADLIAGRQSYRTLRWRLLTTLEIGLAWRALTARGIRTGRSTRPAP